MGSEDLVGESEDLVGESEDLVGSRDLFLDVEECTSDCLNSQLRDVRQ